MRNFRFGVSRSAYLKKISIKMNITVRHSIQIKLENLIQIKHKPINGNWLRSRNRFCNIHFLRFQIGNLIWQIVGKYFCIICLHLHSSWSYDFEIVHNMMKKRNKEHAPVTVPTIGQQNQINHLNWYVMQCSTMLGKVRGCFLR